MCVRVCTLILTAKYKCLQKVKEKTGQADTRLTKSEFRDLIYTICDEIPGDNTFEFFVDFVESCVEVRNNKHHSLLVISIRSKSLCHHMRRKLQSNSFAL